MTGYILIVLLAMNGKGVVINQNFDTQSACVQAQSDIKNQASDNGNVKVILSNCYPKTTN